MRNLNTFSMNRINATITVLAASALVAAASVVGSNGVLARKAHESNKARPTVTQRALDPQVNMAEAEAWANALPGTTLPDLNGAMNASMLKTKGMTKSVVPTNPNGKVRMYFLTCQYWDNPDNLGKGTYYIDVDEDKEKHLVWDMTAHGTFGPYASNGGFVIDDVIYLIGTMNDWTDQCISYKMLEDWGFGFWYQGGTKIRAYDYAYDPWTDTLWGYTYYDYGASKSILAKYDWENKLTYDWTGEVYAYADRFPAFTCDKDWLYGFDVNGNMYKVSKTDGTRTLVGQSVSGLSTGYSTAGVDYKTGRLFLGCTIYDRDAAKNYTSIYEIDKNTAEATLIKQWDYRHDNVAMWSQELSGMDCPELATDIAVDVPAGEQEGFINFNAPSTLRNGDPCTGELDYEVYLNGRLASSGKCQAGAAVAAPITVDAADSYKISVKTSNASGPSRFARLKAIIGMAKPAAPEVSMTYNGQGQPVLSWAAVDKSAKGVEINSEDVTYTVVRHPDNVTVLNNSKNLTVTDKNRFPSELNIYWYGVTSKYCDTTDSDEAVTEGFARGEATPPYEFVGFNSINHHAFNIINNDADNSWFKFDNTYDRERDYLQVYGSSWTEDGYNDDWLVAPAVKLEANKYYRIEFLIMPVGNTEVDYSIRLGKGQTIDDLNIIVKDGQYKYKSPRDFEWHGDFVKVTEGGVYYPAFGMIGHYGTGACVKGYRISEAKDPLAPGLATNFDGRSHRDNAKLLELSFNAPDTDFDGNALTSLDKVVVELDGKEVVSYSNVRPGQALTCTNTVDETGREYTFNVYGINEYGKGRELQAPVYAGVRKSAPIKNAYAWQSAPDKMTVYWDVPEVDEIGNPINPNDMTFSIAIQEGYITNLLAHDLTGNSHTFDISVANPNDQEFRSYQVYSTTEGGDSEPTYTIPVAVGNAIGYPYKESVANASLSQPLGIYTLVGNAKWGLYSDASFTDVTSMDNDGGLLGMNGATVGESALLLLPKIKLTDAVAPIFSIYAYNIAGNSQNELEILINDGSGFKSLGSAVIMELGDLDWNRMKVSLADYINKEVQIAVKGTVINYTFVIVDNISVGENIADNLQLSAVVIPSTVAKGENIPVQAQVTNSGDNEASGYTLQLFRDGEKVDEVAGEPIAAGLQALFNLNYKSTPLDGKRLGFDVKIDYAKDGDKSDNESETFNVSLNTPKHPKVEDLAGTINADGNVELTWSPLESGSASQVSVNDSFETAEAWSITDADGWLLLDKDQKPNGGMQNLTIPNVSGKVTGFFVVDSDSGIFGDSKASWKSQNGSKHLAALYVSGAPNNDWAISPRLTGAEQEITFYARSYSADYPETLRVMYTTGDNRENTDSYVEAQKFANMSEDWTLYKVTLPAGATHFAFNCVSNDCFMLFIDNVSYTAEFTYNLNGYNVYRDGMLVNEEPIADARHIDVDAPIGSRSYVVSAVWNLGESDASNEIMLEVSGVGITAAEDVIVSAADGEIRVLNAGGQKLIISNAAGINIYSGIATDNVTVKAVAGVYALKVGGKTYKVMVK